jgi:hypothetical protein
MLGEKTRARCSSGAATDHDGIGELWKQRACWRLIVFSAI